MALLPDRRLCNEGGPASSTAACPLPTTIKSQSLGSSNPAIPCALASATLQRIILGLLLRPCAPRHATGLRTSTS